VLAERFLIDRLRAFHERYPAIDLEVIGGSRVVSLARREADVALRYGSPKDGELVARRMATICFGLYASRAYRDKLNAGQTPTFIGFDEESDFITEAAWLARHFADRAVLFSHQQPDDASCRSSRWLWRCASSKIYRGNS
jgi:DNA-binding transcriptional LysR family regulator